MKLKHPISNSSDLDETAHHEPSHLVLRCLQKPIDIVYGSERVDNYYKFILAELKAFMKFSSKN